MQSLDWGNSCIFILKLLLINLAIPYQRTIDAAGVKHVSVYGERNSCTTMISAILSNNFDMNCSRVAECIGPLRMWKHDFFRRIFASSEPIDDTLHVLVTRHPYEWLHSMWKRPHYADAHENLPLESFLTKQWRSYIHLNHEDMDYVESKDRSTSRDVSIMPICHDILDSIKAMSFPGSTCTYSSRSYVCVKFQETSSFGRDTSPSLNCLPGHESELVCKNGEFLCLYGTRIRLRECGDGGQSLSRVGELCRRNDSLYECVPGSFEDEDKDYVGDISTCLKDLNLCHSGYILCEQGSRRVNAGLAYPSTSNRINNPALTVPECSFLAHAGNTRGSTSVTSEIGGMCSHAGNFYRCIMVSHRLAAADDIDVPQIGCLSGEESASICHDGSHLCEHDIRFARDPPYVIIVPLLPCHPIAKGALLAGGACIFDNRVYVCKQWPNSSVTSGLEASPSASCRSGAESWGLCDQGSFLCEDSQISYPEGSSRHGLTGQYVRRCDIWPVEEMREIGALCRHGAKYYECVQFPWKDASIDDPEAPFVRCLSGHQSRKLCQHGKYLCEEGVRFEPPEISEGLLQCGHKNAGDRLVKSGACIFDGQEYTCEEIKHDILLYNHEESPAFGCRTGIESRGLCLNGTFLCLQPPDCTSEREASLALAKIGGTCKMATFRYSCQEDGSRRFESDEENNQSTEGIDSCLSFLQHLCPSNHALCKKTRGNRDLDAPAKNLQNHPDSSAVPCENWPRSLTTIGGLCQHMGIQYTCFSFVGRSATKLETTSPSDICFSGQESWFLCSGGKYLCQSSALHNFLKSTTVEGNALLTISSHPGQSSCNLCQVAGDGLSCNCSGMEVEQQVPYPAESNRYGIRGLFVPSCYEVSLNQLSEIGALCRHKGLNFGCTLIPSRKSTLGEIQAPNQRCFSGDASYRFFCDGTRYLCEIWGGYDWLTSEALTSVQDEPECGIAAKEHLGKNKSCTFNGRRYSCQRIQDHFVTSGLEPQPAPHCRTGSESWGLCLDGMFLCTSQELADACSCGEERICTVGCDRHFTDDFNASGFQDENHLRRFSTLENIPKFQEHSPNHAQLKLQHPPLCEVLDDGALWELNKTCVYDNKYFMCTSVPGSWVLDGTEQRPSHECRTGAESWGVCNKGKYLCEEPKVLYSAYSSRFGLEGQYIRRCDSIPIVELRRIGGLCLHNGLVYTCLVVPESLAIVSDGESPDVRCFSGDQSYQLCQDGMYLCEHGQAYQWSSEDESSLTFQYGKSCRVQCGENVLHLTSQNDSCFFGRKCYWCERLTYHKVENGLEESPISRCRSGAESKGLCLDGKFLCEIPPDCSHTVDAAQVLRKVGGVCQLGSNLYRCQSVRYKRGESVFNESDTAISDQCLHFSVSSALCPAGYALCTSVAGTHKLFPPSSNRHGIAGLTIPACESCTSEMREVGSLCEHMGKTFQCVSVSGWSSALSDYNRPSIWCLTGDESARLCVGGKYLCQSTVVQGWQLNFLDANDFPPCIMSLISSIRAAASSCSYEKKVYSCRTVSGRHVHTGLERAPGSICRNGAESWNFCSEGMFLCESIPPCTGASGFKLKDLGGICWSGSGFHQCLKSEHTFGLNTTKLCNNTLFPHVICETDTLLCLAKASDVQKTITEIQVDKNENLCPLQSMKMLRMIGGTCRDGAHEYECRSKDMECISPSVWNEELAFQSSKLCDSNESLCIAGDNISTSLDHNGSNTVNAFATCSKQTRLGRNFSIPGDVCNHRGKQFTCKKIPGKAANKRDRMIPFKGCKTAIESLALCRKGLYLCEANLSYPWDTEMHGHHLAEYEEQKDRDMLDEIKKQFDLRPIHKNWALDTCVWQFGKCAYNTDNGWNGSSNTEKRNFYLEGRHMKHFSHDAMMIMAVNLDQRVEEKFGYKLFLDKETAMLSYNKSSRCAIHWPQSFLWSKRHLCRASVIVPRLVWTNAEMANARLRYSWMLVLNIFKQMVKTVKARFSRFFIWIRQIVTKS